MESLSDRKSVADKEKVRWRLAIKRKEVFLSPSFFLSDLHPIRGLLANRDFCVLTTSPLGTSCELAIQLCFLQLSKSSPFCCCCCRFCSKTSCSFKQLPPREALNLFPSRSQQAAFCLRLRLRFHLSLSVSSLRRPQCLFHYSNKRYCLRTAVAATKQQISLSSMGAKVKEAGMRVCSGNRMRDREGESLRIETGQLFFP